jgi:NAD(P)H-dependent flavin oxidoreductase YrpB (nitropropane dioxygenase family)
VLVRDPFGRANPRLVVAAARADALGVLDLPGVDASSTDDALARIAAGTDRSYAVRLAPGIAVALPPQVTTIVLAGSGPVSGDHVAAWRDRRVLVEAVSLAEAEAARTVGADGIIAKGCETGGRVGDVESFVLIQQVLRLGLPFWVAGGIGPNTAAAAAAAGAAGVVLSDLLALVEEVRPGLATAAAVAAMDGSETRVVGGC